MAEEPTYIVYDGECPFCSAYVKMVRLREALGDVELVSARSDHPATKRLADAGISLDQEMALIHEGRVYAGPECMHRLALMSTPSGAFNRINRALFSHPAVARFAYPVLRAGRNMALALLRRSRIAPRD